MSDAGTRRIMEYLELYRKIAGMICNLELFWSELSEGDRIGLLLPMKSHAELTEAVRAERERCAKIADAEAVAMTSVPGGCFGDYEMASICEAVAAKIRSGE